MGVLTEAFVADADEVSRALELGPTYDDDFPAADVKGLDQVKLAWLAQLILDRREPSPGEDGSYGKNYDELVREMSKPVYQLGDDGPWIFPFPERFTSALAELDEVRLRAAANRWAEMEEFAADHMDGDDALEYLNDLAVLARSAKESSKQLYFWMSL